MYPKVYPNIPTRNGIRITYDNLRYVRSLLEQLEAGITYNPSLSPSHPYRKLRRNEEILGAWRGWSGGGRGKRRRKITKRRARWLFDWNREQCLLLWNYTPFMPLLMRALADTGVDRAGWVMIQPRSLLPSYLRFLASLLSHRRHNAPWLIPRATGFQYSNGGASSLPLSLSSSLHLLLFIHSSNVYLCGGYTLDADQYFTGRPEF